jgi:hypothetical protein
MWVRARHGPTINPIILFDYDPSREKEAPNRLLKDFKGYLQADAYGGYDEVCKREGVIRLGCMAHVRRKFVDVIKVSPKQGDASTVLEAIKKLYKLEEEIREKSIQERKQIRLEKAVPILDEIKSWLDTNQKKYPPLTTS